MAENGNSSNVQTEDKDNEWCLQAQLTIRHPIVSPPLRPDQQINFQPSQPILLTNSDPRGNNLRFEYSWNTMSTTTERIPTEVIPANGITKFESWRPKSNPRDNQKSSSSNSSKFEPSDQKSLGGKSRPIQPYDRRCKSTCTITLTNNNQRVGEEPNLPISGNSEISKNRCKDAETQTVKVSHIEPGRNSQPEPGRNLQTEPGRNSHPEPGKSSKTEQCKFFAQRKSERKSDQGGTAIVIRQKKSRREEASGCNKNEGVGAEDYRSKNSGPSARICRRSSKSPAKLRARSSPPIRLQQKPNPPRTVHIDVYCTGSDESDESSSEETSATPQTVFESSDYKILHHHHTHKKGNLPFYLSNEGDWRKNQRSETFLENDGLSFNLKKLIGKFSRFPKNNITKDVSQESCETNFSSNYPDTREVSRNNTASSFASTSAHEDDDNDEDNNEDEDQDEESSWRESQINSKDVSMEPGDFPPPSAKSAMVPEGERDEQWWIDFIMKKFDPGGAVNLLKKDDDSVSKRFSASPSLSEFTLEQGMHPPFKKTLDFSETHLETATKFGSVVKGFKKPGHHITGPTKNPNCPCDHCRFYFENASLVTEENGKDRRTRALSLSRFE